MPWTTEDADKHSKGLSDKQKEQWANTANAIRSACIKKGGSEKDCDAAAIKQANGVVKKAMKTHKATIKPVQESDYEIRYETHQGKRHIVIPVVMMVEGVHNGSHGPILHAEDELSKYPASWNGIPVVIYHPEENGVNVSANNPVIIERSTVGRTYNADFSSGKLKAEAWLDEERLKELSPEAYKVIQAKGPLEVSVGVFTDDEEVIGQWNDESYSAISRNHRPDHLALLPGSRGACSWEDGCGVRANEGKGGESTIETIVDEKSGKSIVVNQAGLEKVDLSKLVEKLRSKLWERNDEAMEVAVPSTHYRQLEEVYSDFIYYSMEMKGGKSKQYKQKYKLDDNGEPVFEGDPVLVEKEVKYKEVKGGQQTMADKEKGSCCPEKVELLIQSEFMDFGEDQREWLEGQDEAAIDSLLEVDGELAEAQVLKEQNETLKGTITDLEDRMRALERKSTRVAKATPQMNTEQAVKVLKDHLSDPDRFLGLLPEGVRRQMEHGLRLHTAYHQDLIQKIQDNSPEEVYSGEELLAMDDGQLEKIAKLTRPRVDYSLNGFGNRQPSSYQSPVEPLLPPGV